ncbi:MAG: glycosyl hydrolase 53 family protein [Bacteroidales bacterium]|nr:glycosyl hydrolase 53 family protein [Bacteroidales bacterium]
MNRFPSFFAAIVLSVAVAGCKGGGDEPSGGSGEEEPKPVTEVSFARGADISWASEMEHDGISFQDDKGGKDILSVLKNLGMNSIRLRVWVDPYDTQKWSGQEDVVKMAVRALEAGMAVMVDFHYSDIFADPGRQTVPAAWSSYSKDPSKAAAAVTSHTTAVLNALKSKGVVPAWVQVGNETNNGMVWDAGKIDWDKSGNSRYTDYVTLSNAGYNAVKQVFPNTPVIVHIANAFSAGDYDGWFFKEFKEAGGKFDIIGLSHYPMSESGKSWSQMNSLAVASIKTLAARNSCKVMVCEVGVPPGSSESASCLGAFMDSVKGLGPSVCAGVFYWEPEVDGKWKPAIYSKAGLVCNGWGAYGMGAFSSSGKTFKPIASILGHFSE